MSLRERVREILDMVDSPEAIDWNEVARSPKPIEASAILVPGARVRLFSRGHALELESRLQEYIGSIDNPEFSDEEFENLRKTILALEGVLMHGMYVLASDEVLLYPHLGDQIVTEEEMRAYQIRGTVPIVAETPALRAACSVGRVLSADEIAEYEAAEARVRKTRRL